MTDGEYPPLDMKEQLELVFEARKTFGEASARELAAAFGISWCLVFDGISTAA